MPFVAFLDDVSFIDYEYGAYNYSPFDIGNHFNEYGGIFIFFELNTFFIMLNCSF